MDVLGDILRSVDVFSHSLGTFSFAPPWSFTIAETKPWCSYISILFEGDFWLTMEDREPVQLRPGDAFLVTSGRAFQISSDPTLEPLPLDKIWREKGLPGPRVAPSRPLHLDWGSGSSRTRVFTTAFTIQDPAHNPLLSLLPKAILVRREQSDLNIWADAARRFCEREAQSDLPGFSATSLNLIEMILASFIRAFVNSETALDSSWMKGLSDPRIGQALVIMQSRCGEPWTVPLLAEEVGMARSTFARVFQDMVGQPPMKYLVNCRMQSAARYLIEGKMPVSAISEQVGYRSERAFRESFHQCFGLAPRDFLKHREGPPKA